MEYFSALKSVGLFNDIDAASLETMLKCLGPEIKKTVQGEIVLLSGDKPEHIGIVLSGRLHIVREDNEGNRSLIAAVTASEVFAEALCCAGVLESPVTVVADTNSIVMKLMFSRILHICPNACRFHTKLIENMLKLVARKNLQMQMRMELIALKSVRARVLRYLESFAPKHGREIAIPFNREQLAAYLCVDRSALSHELMRMKADGLIDYKKNRFILKYATARHS